MKTGIVLLVLFVVAVCGRKGFGPGDQDWGYVEVRPGAQMFWWLYYTTASVSKPTDRPLVLWIQGGPGGSSTGYGNFKEFGPLTENLEPRNFTWVKDCNVMFVDNPVGTGFSYVESNSLLVKDNAQIARDLVEMMKQFYTQHPEFETVPMYITCESYGGKMVSDFALLLYKEIKSGAIKANFKGVGLGDSWISPVDSVMTWAPYLLNLGVVDQDGYEKINKAAQSTKDAVDSGRFEEATKLWGVTENVVMQVTGNVDFYDVMKKITGYGYNNKRQVYIPGPRGSKTYDFDDIMNKQVKEALGIPSHVVWTETNGLVFDYLNGDFMKPVTNVVESLLNETDIKVFVYSGQKDLIVDTPGTIKWIEALQWKNMNSWKKSSRKLLVVDNIVEGYVKEYGNFVVIWVDRAGHMVPLDNPAAMGAILQKLTNNYSSH